MSSLKSRKPLKRTSFGLISAGVIGRLKYCGYIGSTTALYVNEIRGGVPGSTVRHPVAFSCQSTIDPQLR